MTEQKMTDGLQAIAGCWRNDQPGGLGLVVKDDPEGLAVLRDCILAYHEDDNEQTNAELLAQLAEFGSQADQLTLEEQLAALMVINLLENRGVIKPDQYNGMVFMWIKDRVLFCSPQPPDEQVLYEIQPRTVLVTTPA